MFKTNITATPFTTEAADSFFQNIQGGNFYGDVSFLATLRALIFPRMKEGDKLGLSFGRTSYTASNVGSTTQETVIHALCASYDLEYVTDKIVIHNLASNQVDNVANLKVIENKFTACYPSYHRLEKIKEFYRKSFLVDCYINPELKNVILFVDNLDNKKLHYLQVSVLAFLPWYFDPAKGLSDLEMELVYSLRETTPGKYLDCLNKIAAQYDFRSDRIRQLLGGFETHYEQLQCEDVKQKISSLDQEMTRLNEQIGILLGRRNDACIKLLGLERKIEEGGGESEIMDYFLCNRRLELEQVTDRDMYFMVKDYLTYFDREMASSAIENPRSFVYRHGGQSYRGTSAEKMKMLLNEIFVAEEPRLRIKFCAAYRFDLNGSVSPQSGHTFPYEFSDAMPNPHIDHYSCMGNYTRAVNQLLQHRDYIGALEQCVASCKSLNWGDSPVMEQFMKAMWGNGVNNRCIELPDGRVVKPAEAIQWLEQQEEQNNAQTEEESQNE